MKQQMKRHISLLLALLLCVGLFALPVSAEGTEGECGENLTWTLQNGVLTISGKGAMYDYSQFSPAPWYANASLIQTVVVEKGVTSIGAMAFYQCKKMTVAKLPDSVLTLGRLSFSECVSLKQIIMDGITTIGDGCFYSCISLINVRLPQSVTTIGDQAFYRCKSLGGITIPESVTAFGSSVFAYCDMLTYARILAPIQILPYWTFYGCDELSELYLPETVQAVGENALSECPELYYVAYNGSDVVVEDIQKQLDEETTENEDSTVNTDVSYSESDSSIITTTTNTQVKFDEQDQNEYGTTVEATIRDESGWDEVIQTVYSELDLGHNVTVNIHVQSDMPIPEQALAVLLDRNVTVNIQTADNVDWKVVLQDQSADTLKGKQDLSMQIVSFDPSRFADVLQGAESYLVSLGGTSLNSTILIPLGSQAARKVATLYAVSGRKLNKLSSVIVDYDGKAAFCLAGTSAGDYILALNVPNIDNQEVLVPEKLAPEFDITYGATLTDAQGNQYVLTGRVNKLGFGLGTLTWIIVGVLGGSVILVGVIMVIWNKQQQKMYKQRRKSK